MGHDSRINPLAQFVAKQPMERASVACDALGRPLAQDDAILLHFPTPLIFRVAEITPVLDPSAPPGLLNVHVGCLFSFTVKAGAPVREVVRIAPAAEAGPSQFTILDAGRVGTGPNEKQ